MLTMGVDIGSTACKCVIMKDGKEVITRAVVPLGTGTTGPKTVFEEAIQSANVTRDEIARVLVTGYGRFTFHDADNQKSEITCHATGVHFLLPSVRTIVDIGGQDVKALRLSADGLLDNFVMNDKCAAGTGRFLDVMAGVLDVKTEELGEISSHATEEISISNTCTVFAESEVISQLSNGESRNNIIKGVHLSVASRACGLAYRGGLEKDVVMTGGVAQNAGVVRAVASVLKTDVIVAPNPQTTGALGAALFAYEAAQKK